MVVGCTDVVGPSASGRVQIVLIKNLKEKNPIWGRTTLDCERSVTKTLFMEENSDEDRLN